MARGFQTTNWSLVLAAAEKDSESGREALARLCEAYWQPLYAFLRSQGYGRESALDLTQAYFTVLLEKNYLQQVNREAGRFRSFLLGSLKHFLSNERDKERALKRGGGRPVLSLDAEGVEAWCHSAGSDKSTPERIFEKRWALSVLERALARLAEGYAASGKQEQFERLKVYLLSEKPAAPYKQAAAELGLSESAMKVTVHRMRRQFGEFLREEISETVTRPEEVEDEIRYLLSRMAS